MKFKTFSIFSGIIIGALLLSTNFFYSPFVSPVQASPNLRGRILLQVQAQGQAWYVNPVNNQRYYLGRPADAFRVMSTLGLGISNQDLANFKIKVPARLAGRILLQVQAQGQAWYVDPLNLQLYYLGRPADAFNLMRSQGLGITNQDLANIPTAIEKIISPVASTKASSTLEHQSTLNPQSLATTTIHNFLFKYQDKNYEIFQNLLPALYQSYAHTPKVYTYYQASAPLNLRNAFYGLFLKPKPTDDSLSTLLGKLKTVANKNHWTSDQLLEFTMAFVQYIPYDHAKLLKNNNRNVNPYFPYETLYLDRGVCSDKTFLAVSLIRRLGYGAAILDFPDLNHSAAAVSCPLADSLNGTGYCYIETTNYFPLGVIPQSIQAGQAQSSANQFSNLFNPANLGKIEIYQKTSGKIYQGVIKTHALVANFIQTENNLQLENQTIAKLQQEVQKQKNSLSNLKNEMDNYYQTGQISQYNNLVPTYNTAVSTYNSLVANYRLQVENYNQKVHNFNQIVNNFYQK